MTPSVAMSNSFFLYPLLFYSATLTNKLPYPSPTWPQKIATKQNSTLYYCSTTTTEKMEVSSLETLPTYQSPLLGNVTTGARLAQSTHHCTNTPMSSITQCNPAHTGKMYAYYSRIISLHLSFKKLLHNNFAHVHPSATWLPWACGLLKAKQSTWEDLH